MSTIAADFRILRIPLVYREPRHFNSGEGAESKPFLFRPDLTTSGDPESALTLQSRWRSPEIRSRESDSHRGYFLAGVDGFGARFAVWPARPAPSGSQLAVDAPKYER